MSENNRPPTSAMAVANWFLTRAKKEPVATPIDQLKLYKLVYYAHAWYLGNGRGPLFSEDIEAWPHGPVVRDLYIEFKSAGKAPIESLGSRLEFDGANVVPTCPVYEGPLEEYFESVWNLYKSHSGVQLSNATHAAGEPWTLVAASRDLAVKPTISNDVIAKVFMEKVQRNAAS